MSRVTCYACRKKYNYEEDGFCPRCGAFNLCNKGSYTVAANGDIVRVDGINESGHQNSFVHAEYHAEERERKKQGLDREKPAERVKKVTPGPQTQTRSDSKKQSPVGVIFLVIWLLAVCSVLFSALGEFLW